MVSESRIDIKVDHLDEEERMRIEKMKKILEKREQNQMI